MLRTIKKTFRLIFNKNTRRDKDEVKDFQNLVIKDAKEVKERLYPETESHSAIKILDWLEKNSISQNTLKASTFILFIIVSLGELMTR